MIWNRIFAKGEILTPNDRSELEQIEKQAEPYRKIRERIEEDFVPAMHRIGKLQELAGRFVEDIGNEALYQKMLAVAGMPSDPRFGYQHHGCVAEVFDRKIEDILRPSVEIVRRVLKRALAKAEDELRRCESKERKEAESEGFSYMPSGRIQALQNKVLDLRNGIASKYKFEGAVQSPAHWKERLAEYL